MKLHTVFITYNRLELTKQAIASYLETVSVPFTMRRGGQRLRRWNAQMWLLDE